MDEKQKPSMEEQASTESTTSKGASAEEPGQELLNELSVLADRFVNVARLAWNSDQRKQIETDLRSGLDSLSHSLEEGFQQVSASEEAKQLHTKADEVSQKVTTSQFFADLTRTLQTGLQALSSQLEKVAEDLEKKPAAGTAEDPPSKPMADSGDTEAKDIPIDKA